MSGLTLEAVQTSARRIVEARGADFAYAPENAASMYPAKRCAYVCADDPRFPYAQSETAAGAQVTGCLVGEILADLGALTDRIAASRSGIESLLYANEATPSAIRYLAKIQHAQDTGSTWGDALCEANELMYQ